MGASAAFQGLRPSAHGPEQAPCGFCQTVIQLTYAQQRWLRWQPGQNVFCNQRCCHDHYQAKRRRRPQSRQDEYQRYIQHRRERWHSQAGVIHAEDQWCLGDGWSWVALPGYGPYRCTCEAGVQCAACRRWKEPRSEH